MEEADLQMMFALASGPTMILLNQREVLALRILGTVGPATQFGSNKAGVDLPVSGGLSTGNGMPGGISFRLGTAGDSGNQVNDSTEVSRIDVNGYK